MTKTNNGLDHFPCNCECHEPKTAYLYDAIPCQNCTNRTLKTKRNDWRKRFSTLWKSPIPASTQMFEDFIAAELKAQRDQIRDWVQNEHYYDPLIGKSDLISYLDSYEEVSK